MTLGVDDGNVVVVDAKIMSRRMTLDAYLAGEETNRPQELAYGVLREPAAPGFEHQLVVGRIFSRLDAHVRRLQAGQVVLSPVDVILDAERALVVQPDVAFISNPRLGICTDRIWGAPDLAVEVLSTGNRRHDCTTKVGWFRRYGVRECWLVDPLGRQIEVVDLTAPRSVAGEFVAGEFVAGEFVAGEFVSDEPVSREFAASREFAVSAELASRVYVERQRVRSAVLPRLRLRPSDVFTGAPR